MRIIVLESDEVRISCFRQKLIGHVVFYVRTALEAINLLNKHEPFDQIYLDHCSNGCEVAEWISKHDGKRPYRVVIHSFNVPGAQNILTLLPEASFIPGVWLLDRMEF